MARKNPNIVITGTPGVGKTTHAEQMARATGFHHISVNQIVKDEGFHEGKDEETGSWIVDEDKVRMTLPTILATTLTELRHCHKRPLLTSVITAPRPPRISPPTQHRRLHPRLARLRPLSRALDRPRHRAAVRLHTSVRSFDGAGVQRQEAGRKYGQ